MGSRRWGVAHLGRGGFAPYHVQDPQRIGVDDTPKVGAVLAARDAQEMAEKLRELVARYDLIEP